MDQITPFGAAFVTVVKALGVSASACAVTFFANSAAAEDGCRSVVTRDTVVACVLARSLTVKAEVQGLEATEGRRTAASLLLPSNPSVTLSGGYPASPGLAQNEPLWSATLSQELEIAGQRGARLDGAAAEQRAQQARVLGARREVAASALVSYYDALAAREEVALADRLAAVASAFRATARARAASGVASTIDADLADLAEVRAKQAQSRAEQRSHASEMTLANILAIDVGETMPRIEGDLSPLPIIDTPLQPLLDGAAARRADMAVAVAEREVQGARIALFGRERYPNATISAFVRKDWIGEQSVGLALAVPIPLPAVGRTYAGEISEARSLADRADTEAERVRRRVRVEVLIAIDALAARKQEAALYGPARVQEIEGTLQALADEVQGQRMPLREALVTQQSLIGFLSSSIDARRALCVASVELARAAGVGFDGGAR